ncbi:CotH kinase family protein [candidate division KSB1 bacterium]|nr:CotH kinase family protein [candidate division KSB1 bacterium]
MMYHYTEIFFLLVAIFSVTVFPADFPVINELQSANRSVIQDENGDYSDWLEIYNPTSSAFSLEGYTLSDNMKNPSKWIFPQKTIAPREFLLIFATGKDRRNPGRPLHTNFKLASRGEKLAFFTADGVLLDSVSTGPLAVDVSFGRIPDGTDNWAYFSTPTPGESNTTTPFTGTAEPPVLSVAGGFYNSPFTISINVYPGENTVIYYSTDGSEPGKNSFLYLSPVNINHTTVLKARAYTQGKLASATVTASYFIDETNDVPVVSLSTHPDNLFDDDIGIYVEGNGTALGGYPDNPIGPPANYWEDWERPAVVELFEPDGRCGFSATVGIKMAGKTTRNLPQKSFAVFFRNMYGTEYIDYPLFPDYPVTRFFSFLLRNTGSDNTFNEGGVQFRDGLSALLVKNLDIDCQMYRPCVLYINGEYWGIYSIREKQNEEYLATHHGVDPDNVDILDDYHTLYPIVIEGDADHYNRLIDFLKDHSLSNQAFADYVSTQMNVDNFLTYMAVQIFLANHDGPGHNCKFWRPKSANGIYRWLLYDTDHSFGMRLFIPNFHYAPDAYLDNTIAYYLEENGPSWPNPPESTFLFRKILENRAFRNLFITKLADYLNVHFDPNVTLPVFDNVIAQIKTEMRKHLARWDGSYSIWNRNIEVVEDFLVERPDYLRDHIVEEFHLGGLAELKLDIRPANSGQIRVNSIFLKNAWSSLYFEDVPVQLEAIPVAGYSFIDWQPDGEKSRLRTLTLLSDMSITANFESVESGPVIVINEINYNSSIEFDTGDWIELYNPLSADVDISGWHINDAGGGESFIFPGGTILSAKKYLVICRSREKFTGLYSHAQNIQTMGDLPFGLDNESDKIRIVIEKDQCVDSVAFTGFSPWPWQPNGTGATLALVDPDFDNALPDNWMASFGYGTPGRVNAIMGSIGSRSEGPAAFKLFNVYPNPFNMSTNIEFLIPNNSKVSLYVVDVRGRQVSCLIDNFLPAGRYRMVWPARDLNLASGLFFFQLSSDKRRQVKKALLVK